MYKNKSYNNSLKVIKDNTALKHKAGLIPAASSLKAIKDNTALKPYFFFK